MLTNIKIRESLNLVFNFSQMHYNGPGYNIGGAGGDPAASPQAKSRSVEPHRNIVRWLIVLKVGKIILLLILPH